MELRIELVFPSVWRSVENDRLTPTWPGFLPTSLPGLWFCYWFSPCSEGIFLDSLVLPPSTKKTASPNSKSIRIENPHEN